MSTRKLALVAIAAASFGACDYPYPATNVSQYDPTIVLKKHFPPVLAPNATPIFELASARPDQLTMRAYTALGRTIVGVFGNDDALAGGGTGSAYVQIDPSGAITPFAMPALAVSKPPRFAWDLGSGYFFNFISGSAAGGNLYLDYASSTTKSTASLPDLVSLGATFGATAADDRGVALIPNTFGVTAAQSGVSVLTARADGTTSDVLDFKETRGSVYTSCFLAEVSPGNFEYAFAKNANSGNDQMYFRTSAGKQLTFMGDLCITGGLEPVSYRVRREASGDWLVDDIAMKRWHVSTDGSIEDIATDPPLPAGYPAYWTRLGGTFGARFAMQTVKADDPRAPDVPVAFAAAIFRNGAWATASDIPTTPCNSRDDCRLFGESYLLGVVDAGNVDVAFYAVWFWVIQSANALPPPSWTSVYAVPVKVGR
jgi:hypothetical protein